ncbi:hypothetical protein C8R43DRAFT_1142684 [Mycena crocata]|nr:hypothetical protein C8R43DRAFT_1142684 [Mycena crocata]
MSPDPDSQRTTHVVSTILLPMQGRFSFTRQGSGSIPASTPPPSCKLFCVPGNRSTTTLGANPSFTSTAPSASRMFSCRNSHSNLPAGTANTESLDDISKVITSHCGHFKSISAPLALFARALLPLSPGSAQRVPGDLRTGIDAPSRLHSIQDQTRLNLCM